MLGELGWVGWLLIVLGWLAAGLAVAWLFGHFVKAGKGDRTDREIPSSVSLYTDQPIEEPPAAPQPASDSLNRPAQS